MKTAKAPAAPDPVATAGAQTGSNVSTAIANTRLNQVNQVTPNGNLTYSQTGSTTMGDPTTGTFYDIPQFTATQTLSPGQQAIQDQSNAADLNMATIANTQSGFLKDYLGKGIDTSGLPKAGSLSGLQTSLPDAGKIQSEIGPTAGGIQYGFADAGPITKTYNSDFSADRQRVEDALMARLNPSLERDKAALQTQMSNQGIKLGSTAFDRGNDEFTRQSNDARFGAILNAGQEQSRLVGLERDRATFENSAQQQNYGQLLGRATFNNAAQDQDFAQQSTRAGFANNAQAQMFGQNVTGAGFGNSVKSQQAAFDNDARDRALQEMFAVRNQPINEITSLLSGAQVQNPNFVNTGGSQIPTVDYAGLVQSNYQNQTAAYNQAQASRSQLMGGILGVAGSAATAGIGKL